MKGRMMMTAGLVLTAAALFLIIFNLWDDHRAGKAAQKTLEELLTYREANEKNAAKKEYGEQEIPDYLLNPDMDMPVVEIEGNEYIGILEIPALCLSLPVMSEWSYPKLKMAPCRYAGSAYRGGFVIAGHNYRTHFTPLKNLIPGAAIRFTDVDGNVFFYEVDCLEVLEPEAVEKMTDEDWDLTLFTCTYGGQSRLAVRCTEQPGTEAETME